MNNQKEVNNEQKNTDTLQKYVFYKSFTFYRYFF